MLQHFDLLSLSFCFSKPKNYNFHSICSFLSFVVLNHLPSFMIPLHDQTTICIFWNPYCQKQTSYERSIQRWCSSPFYQILSQFHHVILMNGPMYTLMLSKWTKQHKNVVTNISCFLILTLLLHHWHLLKFFHSISFCTT